MPDQDGERGVGGELEMMRRYKNVGLKPDLPLQVMSHPCVLVCSGADPSGGAGIAADIQAIAAMGAHPLPVTTVLTVQDNERVSALYPVDPDVVRQQIAALVARIPIAAIKIGIVGSRHNAQVIAEFIDQLRTHAPELPVVLDPVLASGLGDALSTEDSVHTLVPLIERATLITPNLPEAMRLCAGELIRERQAEYLMNQGCSHVLIKGGHAVTSETNNEVHNFWATQDQSRVWSWPRLNGAFHGSGCTLAAAIAALLARGYPMEDALMQAQNYCHHALMNAFSIAPGQSIPNRIIPTL